MNLQESIRNDLNKLSEGIRDDRSGRKGFKDKEVASKGGKTASKNRREEALRKYNDIMIDAALKQDEKVFNKAAEASAKILSKMHGFNYRVEKMWSVAKAEALADGSYFQLPFAERKQLDRE